MEKLTQAHVPDELNPKQRVSTTDIPKKIAAFQRYPLSTPFPGANPAPRSLNQRSALQLQRAIGNQALGQFLAHPTTSHEAVAGSSEPDQDRSEDSGRIRSVEVSAVLLPGSNTPETHVGRYIPDANAITARQTVAPSGSPTVSAGGGNDCTPGTEALDWTVVEDGTNWRANVVALTVSGQMHITAWPSAPSTMVVPNTPNPVDGGNINNTPGSPNYWVSAISDLADYDTAGVGGAGASWHGTAASSAHEWAHWNGDYLGGSIPAGNWPQTNRDIDRMTVTKEANADAATARAALEPQVSARFRTFVRAVTAHWNSTSDKDNYGRGGLGYAAGMQVLNRYIASIRAYAASKGWSPNAREMRTAIGTSIGAMIGGGIGALVGGGVGASIGSTLGGMLGGVVGYHL